MRKFIALLFIVFLFLSSICNAFEPPDSNRWFWVNSDSKYGVWIDKQTFKASKDTDRYSPTYNCRFAEAWIMWYVANSNTTALLHNKYNLDRRLVRNLSVTVYNDAGNVISSEDRASSYTSIIPNSWDESILTWLDYAYIIKTTPHQK